MAQLRRSTAGMSASRAGSGSGRRAPAKKSFIFAAQPRGMPQWAYIALLAVPSVLIVGLLVYVFLIAGR